MGNCGGFPYKKPHRRLTLNASQRRPVTVDRDAETDIHEELSTVSQDKPTVSRPHLITLSYPADTPAIITHKLSKARHYKPVDQAVIIGRGNDVDVMLNEEHIPRHFVELRCKCPHVEPKWCLKNVSEKKLIYVTFNGVRTCLNFQEETELHDSCELDFEVLTFVVKIEDGDPGNVEGYELEICQMENDSKTCIRQASTRSNASYTSVASAQARGRQGSASKGCDQRSLQYQYTDHTHFADPTPAVQHHVHYCANVFNPGSPISTCCLHHYPHGCAQQPHQHCHACNQATHFLPTPRKQSDPETRMRTVHNLPSSIHAMGYVTREEAGPATIANAMMTQSPIHNNPLLHCGPATPHEHFSARMVGNLATLQMYQGSDPVNRPGYTPDLMNRSGYASESVSGFGYALPELYGPHPNSTLMYGPSAIHQQQQPNMPQPRFLQQQQQQFGGYTGHHQTAVTSTRPVFFNLLRRSQSMFTRHRKSYQQSKRRSSCDGAELTPMLVAQPESAMVTDMQHGLSEPDVSSLTIQDTVHKVYHSPRTDFAISEFTQIDSLKLGLPAMAMNSTNSPATTCTSTNMSHPVTDSWDSPDRVQMVKHFVPADIAPHSPIVMDSLSSAALLPSPGFSTMNSDLESLCSRREPQENDERQPEGKAKAVHF